MQRPAFSIIIPVYNRIRNLCETLDHLRSQTYPRDRYEVLVAAFRLSKEEVEQVQTAGEGLSMRIVPVPGDQWNVSRARNTGIAEARGDILLLLDADIAARPELLESHAACHLSRGRAVAGAVESFAPYDASRSSDSDQTCELDARWKVIEASLAAQCPPYELVAQPHFVPAVCLPLPWAFFWSGNVSIDRRLLVKHGLYFDESFEGWGAEDMEWGFRISRAGAEMLFSKKSVGRHMPHERDVAKNVLSEQANLRRLVAKHRCLAAEVVARYNDFEANARYGEIRECLASVFGSADCPAGSYLGVWTEGSKKVAAFGLSGDEAAGCGAGHTYPMLGIATWLAEGEVDDVRIARRMYELPPWLRDDVVREARRVSGC